ncbi:hypothetical protein JX265_009142 [Neoarthrinium moseri]|uniref:AB hydrolase-1 domain-containing protein n=1 Tax=Neoarthrinium moseri TaxID=1658444 RepID=A0A9Q0ALF9_9PEZI|nr:hypothetical protein JX265_009142 [Neoarthrinium moseri]
MPVICLVHGAWHHPASYHRIIDPLRACGYTVLAPVNATVGSGGSIAGKTYADDVKRIHEVLLPHLDAGEEATMVCHSYGGIPGTAALHGHTVEERKARGLEGGVRSVLYFAAAAVPQRGMSLYTLENDNWPGWHRQEGEMRLLNPEAMDVFYNDMPKEERESHFAGLMYQSHASLVTPTQYAATEVKAPKIYVVCTNDKCIPALGQQAMANAMGARVIELTCGRSPFLKEAESKELVRLIMDLAT